MSVFLILPFLILAGQTPGVAPASSAARSAAAQPYEEEADEVVITAGPPRGAALGDQKPEVTLDAREVRAYGAATVSELLTALEPQTRSARSAEGGRPIVLLNGRRTSGFQEVRDLPPEAVERVEILPEETSLAYGFRPDQRVVNIVLRQRFRATTTNAELGAATAGGRLATQIGLGVLRIQRDTRSNLDVQRRSADRLLESERDLTSRSALRDDPTDVRPFRTLSPDTTAWSVAGAIARPVGEANGTLSVDLGRNTGEGLQGFPRIDLLTPAASPFSRTGAAQGVGRYVTDAGPLGRETDTLSGRLAFALNGEGSKTWRWSATGGADAARTTTIGGGRADASVLQARLNALDSTFDPFGPLPAGAARVGLPDWARSTTTGADAQLVLNGAVAELPAGRLRATVRAELETRRQESTALRAQGRVDSALSRDRGALQVNLDAPVLGRRKGSPIGDLTLNLNGEAERFSDFGTLGTFGGGATWSPVSSVSLIASYTDQKEAPTIAQLGDPVLSTVGVQAFDFVRGETAEVVQVGGGAPGLRADRRRVAKLGATWRPRARDDWSITANYVRTRVDDPVSVFPAATAAVEAAFPERFQRDAGGRLVQVDVRPVNFDRSEQSEIRWGVNWSRRLVSGSPAGQGRPERLPGAPRTDGDRREGGFGGGGSGQGRVQLALFHTYWIENRILVRPGLPALDLLNGDAAGSRAGQSRNQIDVQAGYNKTGYGVRLNGVWRESTTLRGGRGGSGELRFSDLATLNLRLFADLGQRREWVRDRPWLRGVRVGLNVDNLFDARQDVRDAAGATPISYQPDYLDPVGRTVTITARKLFLPPRPAARPPSRPDGRSGGGA